VSDNPHMTTQPEDSASRPDSGALATQGRQQAAAPAGLRERKKARTHAAIRRHALRLFRQQGYDATTVEQIAEAADVSPSTFFRYFPTKEDVVLQDDMDQLWAEAVRAQPSELSPTAALRSAMQDLLARMTPAMREQLRETAELAMAVPAIRARIMDELARTIGVIARLAGERAGRDPDDLEVRTFAGAVLGVSMAIWFTTSGDVDRYLPELERAIALLEAGLPLSSKPPASVASRGERG
jgi:AcrR family transcriptional regulator